MCKTFSSCRLYSWMRLTWLSKIVAGSMICPVADFSQSAKRVLAVSFAWRNRAGTPNPQRGEQPFATA